MNATVMDYFMAASVLLALWMFTRTIHAKLTQRFAPRVASPDTRGQHEAEFAVMRKLLSERGYLNEGTFVQHAWGIDDELKLIVRRGQPNASTGWVAECVCDLSSGKYYLVERYPLEDL